MANDKGWICPKCGRVYGPWVMSCEPCNLHAVINSQTANSVGSIIGSKPKLDEANSIDRQNCSEETFHHH